MSEMMTDDLLQDIQQFYHDWHDDQLAKLVQSDSRTLEIDFSTLRRARPDIADDYITDPEEVRGWLEEALVNHDFPVPEDFSKYQVRVVGIHDSATEVVEDVGMFSPREAHGEFLAIRGQVSKQTQKTVRLKQAVFGCQRCGTETTIPQPTDDFEEPHECPACERQGPFRLDFDASMEFGVDHQTIRIQTLPEQAENFRNDTIDIHLEADLTHSVAPGDRVSVNTIAKGRLKDENSPEVDLYGEAQSVDKLDSDFDDMDIEPYRDRIEDVAAGEPLDDIAASLAPGHYGDEAVKRALSLQLFGGPDLETPTGGKKRGSIHIFLIGDPGVGKSDLLKRMKQLSPRSVFTTGAGSTKAGLTVAAVKDDMGDSAWTIEAGALVEAHEGLCCIDELDDMDEEDRAGLLEAMSSQEINVSKAGMNPTLPANATILAAANPVRGRFDLYESIGEQIDVTPALISRFDLIFPLKDEIDEQSDRQLARHITDTLQTAQEYQETRSYDADDAGAPPLDDDTLRAYVALGQQKVPRLTDDAKKRIENEYVSVRMANDDDGPVPTTARLIEGIYRVGAAHARMRLADEVTVEDVEIAASVFRSYLSEVGVDPESQEFDVDVIETGRTKSQRDRVKAILSIIESEEDEHRTGVPVETIYDFAQDMDIDKAKVDKSLENLKEKGTIYEPQSDCFFTS